MPRFQTPIELDPVLAPKVGMYSDAQNSEGATLDYAEPEDPRNNPVPDVEYEAGGFPALPQDLTAITSKQLGQLFQAVEAWHEFLNSMLAEADIKATTLREIRDLVKAHVKNELKERGVPSKERDEVFRLDDRFVDANSNFMTARNFAERLDAVKNRLSKRFQLVSREITRRGEDVNFQMGDPDRRRRSRFERSPSRKPYDEGEDLEGSDNG